MPNNLKAVKDAGYYFYCWLFSIRNIKEQYTPDGDARHLRTGLGFGMHTREEIKQKSVTLEKIML